MHWRNVLLKPIVTEKSNIVSSELNQVTFEVHPKANKIQIKEAIELAWPDVEVEKVRVMNMPAKRSRRLRKMAIRKTGWRKAIVTLAPDSSIDLFEGV